MGSCWFGSRLLGSVPLAKPRDPAEEQPRKGQKWAFQARCRPMHSSMNRDDRTRRLRFSRDSSATHGLASREPGGTISCGSGWVLVCPSVFKTGVSSYGDGWVRFLHIPATGVLAEPVSCGVRVSPLPPRAGCLTPFSPRCRVGRTRGGFVPFAREGSESHRPSRREGRPPNGSQEDLLLREGNTSPDASRYRVRKACPSICSRTRNTPKRVGGTTHGR